MITELAPGPECECEWGRTIKNIVCAMDQNPHRGMQRVETSQGQRCTYHRSIQVVQSNPAISQDLTDISLRATGRILMNPNRCFLQ